MEISRATRQKGIPCCNPTPSYQLPQALSSATPQRSRRNRFDVPIGLDALKFVSLGGSAMVEASGSEGSYVIECLALKLRLRTRRHADSGTKCKLYVCCGQQRVASFFAWSRVRYGILRGCTQEHRTKSVFQGDEQQLLISARRRLPFHLVARRCETAVLGSNRPLDRGRDPFESQDGAC
jgi:hypothetical protein